MIIQDFIMEYDNAFPKDFCEEAIKYYQSMKDSGFVENRVQIQNMKRHIMDDDNTGLDAFRTVEFPQSRGLSGFFLDKFWKEIYPAYVEKYSIIQDSETHTVRGLKLQRTQVGQGYHSWHYETCSRGSTNRILAFILYLNDVEEGGETEFLYYPKRIKPEAGKLIMFPSAFTHTHRGNQPLSGDKYILTNWVEY